MNELQQTIDGSSIDERIDLLLDELRMAIQWGRPCIAFAVYRSEYIKKRSCLRYNKPWFPTKKKWFI